MSDLGFVEEGRAFHAGDVIILRCEMRSQEAFKRVRESLDGFEQKAGVTILLVDASVEVVQPRPESDFSPTAVIERPSGSNWRDEPDLPEMGEPEFRGARDGKRWWRW